MNTDREWLEACLGVLLYLRDFKTMPPALDSIIEGVKAQLREQPVTVDDKHG